MRYVASMFTVMSGTHMKVKSWFFLSEVNNLFDMFAIQSCRKNCENTVGHLPRRISHWTEYLIERRSKITTKLSNIHYGRSPLFQGGLETPCKVTVTIPASTKGHLLMQHYEKYGAWTLLRTQKWNYNRFYNNNNLKL